MDSINYELILPKSLPAKDLRKYIISKINNKGTLIRWSIYEISNLETNIDKKKIKINALILNKPSLNN